jgi:hypothetical protein
MYNFFPFSTNSSTLLSKAEASVQCWNKSRVGSVSFEPNFGYKLLLSSLLRKGFSNLHNFRELNCGTSVEFFQSFLLPNGEAYHRSISEPLHLSNCPFKAVKMESNLCDLIFLFFSSCAWSHFITSVIGRWRHGLDQPNDWGVAPILCPILLAYLFHR